MSAILYLLLTSAAVCVNMGLAFNLLSWTRKGRQGALPLVLLHGSAAWVSLMYFILTLTTDPEVAFVFARLRFLGAAALAVCFLLFVLDYGGHREWGRGWRFVLIVGVPVVTQGVLWIGDLHRFFFLEWSLVTVGGVSYPQPVFGWWWVLYTFHAAMLSVMGAWVIFRYIIPENRARLQHGVLLVVAYVVVLGLALFVSPVGLPFRMTPVAMLVMGLIVGWLVLYERLLDPVPFAARFILDSLNAAVVLTDNDNRVTYLNKAARGAVPASVRYVIGEPLEYVYPLYADEIARYRDVERVQVQFQLGRAQDQIIELDVEPLVDTMGVLRGRVFVARDVTETLKLRLQQEQARILRDFIESTAHEFRTGLAIVKTNTHMIRRGMDVTVRTARIDRSVDDLVAIVDKMLEMIDLDYSKGQLVRAAVNVNSMVGRVLNELAGDIAERRQLVTVNLMERLPLVDGSEELLQRALSAIVHNAVCYTPEGGNVWVVTREDAENVVIAVRDDGIGMTAAVQARIFDRFYRADTSYSRRGFGLGLPIAESVVRRHGGEIRVSSALGVGSTFEMVLPTRRRVRGGA